jgi:methionyl-tRNA formyltransferase
LSDPKFLEALSNWKADIFVVVAFKKLPESVWSVPKLGCFNIHASLLPDYRGAAPIHWSIANGENRTGVTSFLINNIIDSGEILLQKSVQIGPNETLSSLYSRLKKVGSELAIETIYSILGEKTKPKNQKLSKTVKKAPKIYSEFGHLELLSNIQDIHNRIRACDISPGASIPMLNGQNGRIKLYDSKIINNLKTISYSSNIQVKIQDNGFYLEQDSFLVEIHTIQWPGKRRMDTSNFLKGYRERGYFSIFGKKIL